VLIFYPTTEGIYQQIYANDLVGKWAIEKVTENGQDITRSIDQQATRWIEFYSDGMYDSDGYPFGRYSGEYTLNGETGKLILKHPSEANKEMHWMVKYDGECLILSGTGRLEQYSFFLKQY